MKNEYFAVYFTNKIVFSKIQVKPELDTVDADLVRRITNDGILDGYDAVRLRNNGAVEIL